MDAIIAAALVNNAAAEKLEELKLSAAVQREVVRTLARWWALSTNAQEKSSGY